MSKRKSAKHEIIDAEEVGSKLPEPPKQEEPKQEPELSYEEKRSRALHKLGILPTIDPKPYLRGLRGKHRIAMQKVLDSANKDFINKVLAIDGSHYEAIVHEITDLSIRHQNAIKALQEQTRAEGQAIYDKYKIPAVYWIGACVGVRECAYRMHEKMEDDLAKARNQILCLQEPKGTALDKPLPEPLQKIVDNFEVRGLLTAGKEGGTK